MKSGAVLPKVFISYSWTSAVHEEWVLQLAQRLRSDGVNAILDKWHLREGQDKNTFMEQMVTDPDVEKVLCICDRAYKEKADARKGGVGTESVIISEEVYRQVQQEKFIPIAREFDEHSDAPPTSSSASGRRFSMESPRSKGLCAIILTHSLTHWRTSGRT